MKIVNIVLLWAVFFGLTSCFDEERVGPELPNASTFISPLILNGEVNFGTIVLDPEKAEDDFEVFEWERAEFGLKLPVEYTLEAGDSEAFSNVSDLGRSVETTIALSVDDFNSALLGLGLPTGEPYDVKIRVKAIVQGAKVDTLYSNVINRKVVPYRLSDCGNHCTLGVIGSATPGGWDSDTDMRLINPEGNKSLWTVTLYLNTGEVKFRAGDGWTINWGSSDYPSGVATQDGPNIPINTAGYYKVIFNDANGEYSFEELAAPEFTTIGIIGSATPGGWDSDTDLTQDPNDPHVWTGTITLTDGEAKLRANDDWAFNWGETTYPTGYGIGNGPNIPVPAGTYTVWFNDVTGEYIFLNNATRYATIGVIGDATPGGWDSDTDLVANLTNPYKFSGLITITDGEAKFRADDAWDANWGAPDFPSGSGLQNGVNIPVKGGTYFVTFNSGTGEYKFLK